MASGGELNEMPAVNEQANWSGRRQHVSGKTSEAEEKQEKC